MNAALGELNLRMMPLRATSVDGFRPIPTAAFECWRSFPSEAAATPALAAHFAANFRLPRSTQVEDVHGAESLLKITVRYDGGGREVVLSLSGKPDLIVADSVGVIPGDVYSIAHAALCLVELKTEHSLATNRARNTGQALLELLGAAKLCGYDVPVVLTDLKSGIRIFKQQGLLVFEYVGSKGGPLTLAEANGILAVLLPMVRNARARCIAAMAATPRHGGGDVGGDGSSDGGGLGGGGLGGGGLGGGGGSSGGAAGSAARAPAPTRPLLRVVPGSGRGDGGAPGAPSAPISRGTFTGHSAGQHSGSQGTQSRLLCGDSNPLRLESGAEIPTLSAADALLYADVEAEERGRSLEAVVSRSPQIMQYLLKLVSPMHTGCVIEQEV